MHCPPTAATGCNSHISDDFVSDAPGGAAVAVAATVPAVELTLFERDSERT